MSSRQALCSWQPPNFAASRSQARTRPLLSSCRQGEGAVRVTVEGAHFVQLSLDDGNLCNITTDSGPLLVDFVEKRNAIGE